MEPRSFTGQVLAQAVGTLVAAAVIYIVGVVAGVFTFDLLVTVVAVFAMAYGLWLAYVGMSLLGGGSGDDADRDG